MIAFNKNKIKITAIFMGLLIIWGFINLIISANSTFGQFSYPSFYSNDTTISRNDFYTKIIGPVQNLPTVGSSLEFPVYMAEQKTITMDTILFTEGFTPTTSVPGVTEILSFISKDKSRFLQIKWKDPEVWTFFYTKGSAYGKVNCNTEPPNFILDWYDLEKEDTVTDLESEGSDSCELNVYQKLENSKIVAKNYQPLCTVTVSKSEITKMECVNSYLKTVGEPKSYKITSSYEAFVNVNKKNLQYGLVSKYDAACESEECEIGSALSTKSAPLNLRISTADIVYVPISQGEKLFLIPEHRLIANGSVTVGLTGKQNVDVPVEYKIIFPAIQLSYFGKN